MPDQTPPLTDSQMALLLNLTVLEDAGLIDGGSAIFLPPGHEEVEAPPVVTPKGRARVAQHIAGGRTLII